MKTADFGFSVVFDGECWVATASVLQGGPAFVVEHGETPVSAMIAAEAAIRRTLQRAGQATLPLEV